ncbi:hypothetical protein [Pseudovibrio sp. SCP19]|uniref:hypothetical protein n=1 Tax=Pseudovibrio sp. SCP19 TaxID=3141374 RepID=UPI00333CC87B
MGAGMSEMLIKEIRFRNSEDLTCRVLPPDVVNAEGMLSREERSLLYLLARDHYRGDGVLIDGGSFLGSSTVSLAHGIRDNTHSQNDMSVFRCKPIQAFEIGFLPRLKNGKEKFKEWGAFKYRFGDSFIPRLEQNIENYSDLIDLHVGDLVDFKFPATPIEICFIDVGKSVQLDDYVNKNFLANLIPGKSILVNQDFYFDRLPWIKVTMGYLKDYFEWIGQVRTSVVYKNTKKIPQEVLSYNPFRNGTLDECIAYHDSHVFPDDQSPITLSRLALSRALLIALKSTKELALADLKDFERIHANVLSDGKHGDDARMRYERTVRQISNGMILKQWGYYPSSEFQPA